MTTQRCAFPERLFEFVFNVEYIERHKASIVGAPDIPGQSAEKWLGYDVALNVTRGRGITGSLALQHKVPRLVDGPGSSSNRHIQATAGPTYFATPLDVDQFNIIRDVASAGLPGIEFYYCAPLFVSLKELYAHYEISAIEPHSLWIDVAKVSPLDPAEPHSLVYATDGRAAWVFSTNPQELTVVRPWDRLPRTVVDHPWTFESVVTLYRKVFAAIDRAWSAIEVRHQTKDPRQMAMPRARPREVEPRDIGEALHATADLLSSYLGMSWLIEVSP